MMEKIGEVELSEIIESYGLKDLDCDRFIQVEPDAAIYTFHDKKDRNTQYILLAADYLGGYDELELPHEFVFDYYPDNKVRFDAVQRFPYVDGAKKAAVDYVDDKHLVTRASTGDVCMLFGVDSVV